MPRVHTEIREGGVRVVVMTGDGLNPLDLELIEELVEAFATLDADRSCRAIVLASADRHFCAGATSKFAPGGRQWSTADLYALAPGLFSVDTPVVVALNGASIGGGAGLALVGDWRQMASDARVQINFTKLGYTPGFGLTLTLPHLVGHHRASDLLLSGRAVTAEEALAIGLSDGTSEPASLLEDTIARALVFAEAAPLAVRALKSRQLQQLRLALPGVLAEELALQEQLKSTADYAEGMAAMKERRPPVFEAH
jgi:2-(1,2-epoxy-1,2-dihydrophenyl)acetyl-CoA isomerase